MRGASDGPGEVLHRGVGGRLLVCPKTKIIIQLDDEGDDEPERNNLGVEVLILSLTVGL